MRSAETSGVGNSGFRRSLAQISPITGAVACTAFIAASLFVLTDLWRSQNDAADAISSRAAPGQHFVATAFSPAVPAGPVTAGVLQRAAVAYALAIGATLLSWRRRRPKGAAPEAADSAGLLATMPFGIACWTADGRLVACNDQFRARLNAKPDEIRVGSTYAAAVRLIVQGGYLQMLSEDDSNRVLEMYREDGSCLMVDERPLPGGGFVTLLTDVTESRRTSNLLSAIREEQRILARRYHEEKLRAELASRSKTTFLAHISHDIRTPLNHIIGFAELMKHETYGPLGDRRYVDYVDTIRTSGERLLEFFSSTLDLAELESGSRTLTPTEFDADLLLDAMLQRFAPQAKQKGLSLVLRARCSTIIAADRYALERMLSNIVDNAIRFTPARGRVELAAYAASDGVVLEVTDNGYGMSQERLAAVSQPFSFGDATLTREHEGAGLGLAIARAIVELSGGHIAIDSRPSLGTTVAISLPRGTTMQSVSAAA
jgi:two-component system cell cycle sensor histidine kinase PleC